MESISDSCITHTDLASVYKRFHQLLLWILRLQRDRPLFVRHKLYVAMEVVDVKVRAFFGTLGGDDNWWLINKLCLSSQVK